MTETSINIHGGLHEGACVPPLVTAYIGIGSNLSYPQKNCAQAIANLSSHPDIILVARSSFYETEPVGLKEQGWYVNAVIEVQTSLIPAELLAILLKIEKEMGRERREKWGPRLIDLDLLFYSDLIVEEKNLKIPHPEISKRRFVLEPLCEIAENFQHPVLNKRIFDILTSLPPGEAVRRIN